MWKYLTKYHKTDIPPVFLTRYGRLLHVTELHHILERLGSVVGVRRCNPHKFRHTSEVMYMRNGGDVFSLQEMLGHKDTPTTRIYANLDQEDFERTHVASRLGEAVEKLD